MKRIRNLKPVKQYIADKLINTKVEGDGISCELPDEVAIRLVESQPDDWAFVEETPPEKKDKKGGKQ